MKKGAASVLYLVLMVLLSFPFSAMASPGLRGLTVIDKIQPNGEYGIYAFKEGKWEKAGDLTFDRFFREKGIDLSRYTSDNKPLRIRIVQKGGGAAHIDSVFLNDNPPVQVNNIDNGLKKLSKKDSDVIDAFDKTLEMTFPAGGNSSILKITARVEDTTISKTPFQFPYENIYKTIDEQSRFYTYKISNKSQSISFDEKPFFKVLSPTGSGHPTEFTYGWVWNDKTNLYVTIDFTPDNTMDGNKDYAKVYVKTGSGVKEFKISEYERKWGDVNFTYTDKVAYQHKLYSFRIPLEKAGINQIKDSSPLQLAFAAYGTASPGNYATGMAFDPTNNRHLAVFFAGGSGGTGADIYGLFIDCNGNPIGSPFWIAQDDLPDNTKEYPAVAFDTTSNRYLVAWQQLSASYHHIIGALLDSNGVVIDPPGIFPISDDANDANQYRPGIALGRDTGNNPVFIVMWQDTGKGTAYDTFVRAVYPTSTLPLPSYYNLSAAASDQYHGSISYNSADSQFMVVWQEDGLDNDIYGRRFNVSPAGIVSPLAAAFIISNSAASHDQDSPVLAYDPVRNQYLVVWDDDFGGDSNIYGRLVNAATEALIGSELNIATGAVEQSFPQIAYFASQNRYLVAWENGDTASDVYGQYIDAVSGLTSGSNFLITGGTGTQSPTAISYNSLAGNLILAYVTDQNSSFVRIGPICGGAAIPTLSEWGMIIFIVLAGLGAIYYIRRQKTAKS